MMQGGNAVDGALATLLCNANMNPFSMGLGGGFFMVVYNRWVMKETMSYANLFL